LVKDFDIVILTGAGRAFSAGGEVAGRMQKNVEDPSIVDTVMVKRVVFAMLEFPKPIITKLRGRREGELFCGARLAPLGKPASTTFVQREIWTCPG
jgi:hypothetical protein